MSTEIELYLVKDQLGTPRGLIKMPAGTDMVALRQEFRNLNQAGPNPQKYDFPEQLAWTEKVFAEEDRLAKLYGGSMGGTDGQRLFFSEETFLGWLEKEKGGERLSFKSVTFTTLN